MSAEHRSALMARIRSVDTQPEMVVRRLLHGLGYRYILHDKRLPGKPDLVFPSRNAVVQVHGCFWHGHSCSLASKPKSNSLFWTSKIQGNRQRDTRNEKSLHQLGWRIVTVWECETRAKSLKHLERRLTRFLDK